MHERQLIQKLFCLPCQQVSTLKGENLLRRIKLYPLGIDPVSKGTWFIGKQTPSHKGWPPLEKMAKNLQSVYILLKWLHRIFELPWPEDLPLNMCIQHFKIQLCIHGVISVPNNFTFRDVGYFAQQAEPSRDIESDSTDAQTGLPTCPSWICMCVSLGVSPWSIWFKFTSLTFSLSHCNELYQMQEYFEWVS